MGGLLEGDSGRRMGFGILSRWKMCNVEIKKNAHRRITG